MFLRNLSLLNFKNYSHSELSFSKGVNCFTGNNGAGKTNLLDAIHYLALCKSYFNAVDSQHIGPRSDAFVLQGTFDKEGRDELITCRVKRGQKKQFRRNKKDYERLADHIGFLPVVMISPYDISLVLEGREERRRFIDNALSQTDTEYLHTLIAYNKVLATRNSLLAEFRRNSKWDPDLFDIYNAKLIQLGEMIYMSRKMFMENFVPLFQTHYTFLSENAEQVSLVYESQVHEQNYAAGLQSVLERDKATERTNFGVHKDDLEFKIAHMALKKFASQGQQKSFLIALKLAHYSYLKEKSGAKPILLLDDIFDKLDQERIHQLMQMVVQDEFGQIFVSDTSRSRVEGVFEEIGREAMLFEVKSGEIVC